MKLTPWLLAGIAASPVTSYAFETRLNGFISVGAGMTLQEGQEYVTDPVNFGQYTNEVSIKPDTMVAIQTSSRVNDRLSATAQLVGFAGAKQFVKTDIGDIEVDRGFDVNFEWAYVNYELTNNLDIKFGRIRMPVFFYSSSLDLGYSYNWVRPPVEVYNVFLTSLEGVSADYNFTLGNWYGKLTGYYGETEGTDPETQSIVTFDSILGGVVLMENGFLSLRGSYSIDDDVSIERTYYVPVNTTSVAPKTESFPLPITFASGSAIYDDGTYMLGGEYTSTKFTNNLNNDEIAWYTTAGIRLGAFTPHVTYSNFKQKQTASDDSLVVVPNKENTAYGVYSVNENPQSVAALTFGLRWDFDIATAMKFEYTMRKDNSIEPTGLEGKWSPFGDAQVISLAVDVVF